jgi:hypothetical protein
VTTFCSIKAQCCCHQLVMTGNLEKKTRRHISRRTKKHSHHKNTGRDSILLAQRLLVRGFVHVTFGSLLPQSLRVGKSFLSSGSTFKSSSLTHWYKTSKGAAHCGRYYSQSTDTRYSPLTTSPASLFSHPIVQAGPCAAHPVVAPQPPPTS